MNISSLCCVLDTCHLDFVDALIGGFEGPLHNGPLFGTIFPKYCVSLADPYIYDLLKAYILPLGFMMDTGSKSFSLNLWLSSALEMIPFHLLLLKSMKFHACLAWWKLISRKIPPLSHLTRLALVTQNNGR